MDLILKWVANHLNSLDEIWLLFTIKVGSDGKILHCSEWIKQNFDYLGFPSLEKIIPSKDTLEMNTILSCKAWGLWKKYYSHE